MAIALTGGRVVTCLSPSRVVEADILIEGGRVVGVTASATSSPSSPSSVEVTKRHDVSHCLVLPGNVCAHTHLYSSLARGMPYGLEPPANFVQILQRVWWRLDRALDEESVRASALVGGMEALLAGTTTVVDHHASPNAIDGSLDVIADTLEELGMRSVLCYEATDRDGPGRAASGLGENRRFLDASKSRPLTRAMVGAHASFTLSEETLAACVDLAHTAQAGIHIHVAEDRADQLDSQARFGKPVVERLAEAGALDERSLLAHCVHVRPQEIALIQESSAAVAHNSRSNMNNSVGRSPADALGARIALGTDGIGADMFVESQVAYWRNREADVFAEPGATLARLAHGGGVAGTLFGEPSLGRL
jgi:cytosine/adenosine deaminase-related metal-dependent hydrolase